MLAQLLACCPCFHVFPHVLPQRNLQHYVHHLFLSLEHTHYWQEGVPLENVWTKRHAVAAYQRSFTLCPFLLWVPRPLK